VGAAVTCWSVAFGTKVVLGRAATCGLWSVGGGAATARLEGGTGVLATPEDPFGTPFLTLGYPK